jgi:threonine dehydrogenase-like Zn-dependent dehydrogenase
MQACIATGEKRRTVCQEIPAPAIEPGMLLLKTKYACICGSDLEYLDGSLSLIGQGITHAGAIIGHKAAADLGLNQPVEESQFGEVLAIRPGSIPGHEFVAEVVEVGGSLTGWAVGDRVVPGFTPTGSPPPGRLYAGFPVLCSEGP